jgi:hypothetical protein
MKTTFIVKEISEFAKKNAKNIADKYVQEVKSKASNVITDCTNEIGKKAGICLTTSINKGGQAIATKLSGGVHQPVEDSENFRFDDSHSDNIDIDSPQVKEDMSDKDDEEFLENLCSNVYNTGINEMKSPGLSGLQSPTDALSVVNYIAELSGEVEKFREVQKTKRCGIEAEKEVTIQKLQIQKEFLLKYLNDTFDERRENFEKIFNVVDDAIAKDNMQQLAAGINAINELSKCSPFRDLANINHIGDALKDKNHKWDF